MNDRVIVFRSDLLPRSETFIKTQVLALTRWRPILVGYRFKKDGLSLDGLDARLAPGLTDGLPQKIWLRLCQWLSIAHPPTVRTLRKIDAKLVHVHFGTDAVDVWPSVRKLNLPMLVTLHGFDINIYREWWEVGHGGTRRRRYPRQLLRLARAHDVHFIAVSKAIKVRATKFGIPEDKISICYIGVNTDIFYPGPIPIEIRPKRVLFVGRLVEKKGVGYLIKAFAKLQKTIPDAELVIIGAGPMQAQLKCQAADLGVAAQFLGALANEQVRQHMLRARVFCLPSVTAENGDAEGLPIVILEALASGLPVITSARGGVSEAVQDGYNGICVKGRDVDALSCGLASLLLAPEIATLSQMARSSVVQRMSIVDCVAHLQSLYSTYGLLLTEQSR